MEDNFNFSEEVVANTGRVRGVHENFSMYSDVEVIVRDKHGNIKSRTVQHNLRTNAGADFFNTQLFATGAAGAQANYIALTTDTVAPAATDTTLTSELTTNGLARAQASISHTAGATSTTLSHTWTYTGSSATVVAKVGLFTASSAGTMALETLLAATATVSANGDTITVNWTVNF